MSDLRIDLPIGDIFRNAFNQMMMANDLEPMVVTSTIKIK